VWHVDYLCGGEARYTFANAGYCPMAIRDEMRKCVVFLGLKKANGSMHTGGSAFWIIRVLGETRFAYLVTARHCIDEITKLGLKEVYIRANFRSGKADWIKTRASDWKFHPQESIDVAILQRELPAEIDHLGFEQSWFYGGGNPPKFLRETPIGIGDEVFVVGLFTQRVGNNKNIPIIRMGNVSAMADNEEPVQTTKGPMVACLIESHSIGGLSGSPVFVECQISGAPNHSQAYYLLGLMHGHFGCDDLSADSAKKDGKLNSGITAVVPCERITETVDHHFAESERVSVEKDKIKNAVIPDPS